MSKSINPKKRLSFKINSSPYQELDQVEGEINLHETDLDLIRLIRAIEFGTIENIEIKDGKVLSYKTAWKMGKFV